MSGIYALLQSILRRPPSIASYCGRQAACYRGRTSLRGNAFAIRPELMAEGYAFSITIPDSYAYLNIICGAIDFKKML